MRHGKKRSIDAPYETLSDIAIGSLGVFIILVVVLVTISTLHSSGTSDVFEKIKNENDFFESEIIVTKKKSANYKSNNYAKKEIRVLRKEYDKTKNKLNRMEEKLFAEKEALRKKAEKFREVDAEIDVLDQQEKERTSLVVELDKLKIQLNYFIDRVTGTGVDKTGRPFMKYGTFTPSLYDTNTDTLYLIGREGTLTKDQFFAFLNSIRHSGERNSFFIRFDNTNSRYKQDSYEPQWSKDWWYKANWRTTDVPIKPEYK